MAVVGAFFVGIGAALTGGAAAGITAGVIGGLAVASTIVTITTSIISVARAGGANAGINGQFSIADGIGSPTYSFGRLVTQTNSAFTVPIVYGQVKLAGNVMYQDGSTTVKRLTSFCFGEIEGFSDIRLNDLSIDDIQNATYNTYTGNGTQAIDSRVPGATQADKAAVVGGLRHEAYIATTITANDQISGDFNITALVSGKKVNVYDVQIVGHDGSTLVDHNGDNIKSVGSYFTEYSNNPAYCLLDLLTSYEGMGMSLSEVDLDSFIDTARNCDEEVDGQPRFTLNIVLDQKKSALGWIAEICKASQSIFGRRGNKWFMIADKAEDTSGVPTFTKDHINDFTSWFLPMDDTYDIFNVNYKDADYQWTFVQARAEASTFLRDDYPLINTVDILGVTNFNQASRLAWFYLNQATTTPMFIGFKTSKKGLDLTVGDVIAIDDYLYGFSGKFYRVLSLDEAQNNQVQIAAREYSASLYSDTAGSADPVINFLQNETVKILINDFSGFVEDHDGFEIIAN